MASEENYSRARTVLCPRFLYYLHVSLMEKRSLSSSSLSSSSSSSSSSFPFAQKSIRRRLDRVLLSVQILASRVHTILMACVFVPANVGVFSLRSSILDVEPIYTFRGHRCVVSFYLSRECYVEKGSVELGHLHCMGKYRISSSFCKFTDLALSRHIEALLYSSRHRYNYTMPIAWISFESFPVILRKGNFFNCLPKSKK